jgi:hypothetical protein
MASPDSLLKRARKLERRESYLTLLDAIGTRPLRPLERNKFLGRIMALTASGAITPREAQTLAKAVNEGRRTS